MNSKVAQKKNINGTETDNRRHMIKYLLEKLTKLPPADGEAYFMSEDWPYLWRKQPDRKHSTS